jgi:alkanesulfonate monooxygenase SsuD/methylene tetrahydromethanopterin reductase-like flavin-dependent oxidoreductase (luciferase family)
MPSVKAITEAYRTAWQAEDNAGAAMPLLGVFRHVVVAESDTEALDIARAAHRPWRHQMEFLWEWGGVKFPIGGIYLEEFDELQAMGMSIVGTPETVRRYIAARLRQLRLPISSPTWHLVASHSTQRRVRLYYSRDDAGVSLKLQNCYKITPAADR